MRKSHHSCKPFHTIYQCICDKFLHHFGGSYHGKKFGLSLVHSKVTNLAHCRYQVKEGNPLVKDFKKDFKTSKLISAYTLFSCPNASSFVQIWVIDYAVDYAIFCACNMCNGNISGLCYNFYFHYLSLKRTNYCPSCQFHQIHCITYKMKYLGWHPEIYCFHNVDFILPWLCSVLKVFHMFTSY